MNIKIFAILIISITLNSFVFSQDEDTLTAKQFRILKKEMAISQIKELKEGVLLVQLKTSQNTIDAYAKKGNLKKALKIKMRQDNDNKSIIKGFKDYYNFCPVYFYYSTDRKLIKNKEFNKIIFLDDSLKATTTSIDLSQTKYYISGITTNNYANTTLDNIPNYKAEYDNSIQFNAFIIKNNEFQQLSAPFPYYSKTHQAVRVNDKKRWEAIKRLNIRLHNFYKSNK